MILRDVSLTWSDGDNADAVYELRRLNILHRDSQILHQEPRCQGAELGDASYTGHSSGRWPVKSRGPWSLARWDCGSSPTHLNVKDRRKPGSPLPGRLVSPLPESHTWRLVCSTAGGWNFGQARNKNGSKDSREKKHSTGHLRKLKHVLIDLPTIFN
jgi:hypothetical protein